MKPIFTAFLIVLLGSGTGLWSESRIESTVIDFRNAEGLSVPALTAEFSEACASRAQSLAEDGVLSHLDVRSRGPGVQMLSLGFPPGEYGEILGSGATWEGVWTAWQASKTHREVLVSEGWTRWGWGRYDLEKTSVWVLRFYRP